LLVNEEDLDLYPETIAAVSEAYKHAQLAMNPIVGEHLGEMAAEEQEAGADGE